MHFVCVFFVTVWLACPNLVCFDFDFIFIIIIIMLPIGILKKEQSNCMDLGGHRSWKDQGGVR